MRIVKVTELTNEELDATFEALRALPGMLSYEEWVSRNRYPEGSPYHASFEAFRAAGTHRSHADWIKDHPIPHRDPSPASTANSTD